MRRQGLKMNKSGETERRDSVTGKWKGKNGKTGKRERCRVKDNRVRGNQPTSTCDEIVLFDNAGAQYSPDKREKCETEDSVTFLRLA